MNKPLSRDFLIILLTGIIALLCSTIYLYFYSLYGNVKKPFCRSIKIFSSKTICEALGCDVDSGACLTKGGGDCWSCDYDLFGRQ